MATNEILTAKRQELIIEAMDQNPWWGIWKLKSPKNEIWAEKESDNKIVLSQLLADAQNDIRIVCGGLNSLFYEGDKTITTFRNFLKSKEANITIVFSKGVGDINEAIASLQEENPKLFELARENKGQLKLYWVEKRPIQHYTVIDGDHLFFEEPHVPGEKRTALFRWDDPELGKEWQEKFNRYVENKAKLIPMELPVSA